MATPVVEGLTITTTPTAIRYPSSSKTYLVDASDPNICCKCHVRKGQKTDGQSRNWCLKCYDKACGLKPDPVRLKQRIGRNQACPCGRRKADGSIPKFKICCGIRKGR